MQKKGRVKWFSNVKGYGFIQTEEGGPDVFVHYSEIQAEGFKSLRGGQEVAFELQEAPRGPVARQVRRVLELEEVDA
jgi:CspA family cold shock protein